MSELYQNAPETAMSPAARAATNACRRSYKAFCAGRRKALETFARAPGRQLVVYTTTPHDYVPLLSPTIDPRAISCAWRATAIVVFARRNDDGSITRCIAPLFYRNAGQLISDLASSDEVAGVTLRHWFALSQRCGSILADHILTDRRPQ